MTSQDDTEPFRDETLAEGDAYALMRPHGVRANSSSKDLHLAGLGAQSRRQLDPASTKAWADLRNASARLALDLGFFYPGGFGESAPTQTTPTVVDIPPPPIDAEALAGPPIAELAKLLPTPKVPRPARAEPKISPPALDRWALAKDALDQKPLPAPAAPIPETFLPEEDQ